MKATTKMCFSCHKVQKRESFMDQSGKEHARCNHCLEAQAKYRRRRKEMMRDTFRAGRFLFF